MPFSRIALHQGKSAQYLKTLSDSLHQALVETFSVPPADKFQAIDQYRPGELIYDRDYLGGPRSVDFVLFYITAGRPRDTLTKQRFYQRLAELLAKNLQLRPQDVMVVITTTQLDEWSFSAGRASMIEGQADAADGLWDNSAIIS
ncbi:MAG: tautomerase family protein [Serratia proteamaculans]|jgi:phenylpyruvate tautomerase PptA (4-oxalocrotonate tautomerase family)|uniref:tautomerase family protein n=1 Tax=Serratia proteamaculans TaxID=28151 RepID=UPI000D975B2E|nr:tautomerase family protein [Serratia proteamaculans]SPZ53476.1 Tautomerase enzyme [Serratia quinivorans]KAB1496593.1 tautomerase family protein [Serratia proteamaculans]NWA73583.1 tautomerase family protein [Serratia proteamaculans]RYM54116.1 tautomerase family protein [Serratia proteamaculans]CAI0884173.1 Tautomerase enzyme [Serratia proteamaculans]